MNIKPERNQQVEPEKKPKNGIILLQVKIVFLKKHKTVTISIFEEGIVG